MKKIYVLTFTDSINYGALLQAYSFQSYLESIGYESILIDYHNFRRNFCQVNGYKRIRSIIWHYTFGILLMLGKRERQTRHFKNKFIKLTPKAYRNIVQLKELNKDGDYFFVGSDQVWNPSNNANDEAYFLSFVNGNRKSSYAASFGTSTIDIHYLRENKKYIESLNSISVREESGRFLLRKNLKIDAKVVLDPVFLLDKIKWEEKFCLSASNKRYILCYLLPGNTEVKSKIYEIAGNIAQKTGLPIITVGKKRKIRDLPNEFIDTGCGPCEFINYLFSAEYVVTNSFHGTAFSIIFNKNFWTVVDTSKKTRNTRIECLLDDIKLSDRIINYESSDLDKDIDYTITNSILEQKKNESREFILSAINQYKEKKNVH